jgi:spore coat polysaccharide biosynthesis predicted glycosyltransferase SpsG
VGPFGDRAALAAAARACRRDVRLHVEPSAAEMRDLALEADLAVSAGGGTLYELAWAGCPTVAFELAPNQAPNVRALGRAGVAVSAGAAGAADFLARVTEEVTGLLQSPSHRRALGDAGRALVDGRGAIRIAESLLGR